MLDSFRSVISRDPVPPDPKNIEIIVAWYGYGDYHGSAIVVYRDKRDGKLYEVNGWHCSCYQLEGQWKPEEVVVKELLARPVYADLNQSRAEDKKDIEDIRRELVARLG